jgi:hypothetical protein
MKRSIA